LIDVKKEIKKVCFKQEEYKYDLGELFEDTPVFTVPPMSFDN